MSLGDDDDTPIIDEGYSLRSRQIDWTRIERHPPSIVVCRSEHAPYRSHAKYDAMTDRIIARLGCPLCHTHEMRSAMSVPDGQVVTGEIMARERQTITAADVTDIGTVLGPVDDDEPDK